MSTKLFTTAIASAFLIAAAPGVADHNSKNGEGTANMPNDIHNTRVETLESNDSETFREFVRYGEGSTTVNRFESEDTQPRQASRVESRTRLEPRTSSRMRSDRSATSTRDRGGRKGGRKR